MAKYFESFYGEPGGGKSRSILAVIRRQFEQSGGRKRARVWIGDGSASIYQPYVKAGIVEVSDYSARSWPLTTTQQMADGHWPEDPEDPESPLKPTPFKVLKEEIGVYVFEGYTVMASYVQGHVKGGLSEQAGRGVNIGGGGMFQIYDAELDKMGRPVAGTGPATVWGSTNLAHYGVVQGHVLDRIRRSRRLPCDYVIWTGHPRVGESRDDNEKVIGPEVSGKALTAGLPKEFNNTLHFTKVLKTAKTTDVASGKQVTQGKPEYRIYTADHWDPDGTTPLKFIAVTRAEYAEAVPLYLTGGPGEAILKFYDLIEAAQKKAVEETLAAAKAVST